MKVGVIDSNLKNDMTIADVRNNLIIDLEDLYTPEQIDQIDRGLTRLKRDNGLSNEDLDYYCTANSSEMFSCIFDGKEFDHRNFEVD